MSKRRKKKNLKNCLTQQLLAHRILMLEELFLRGVPVNNTTLRGGKQVGNLSTECLQYIIYRSYQDWKPSQIADSLGITTGGVKFEISSFHKDAVKFYRAKIVERIEAPDDRNDAKYLCRLHGEQFNLVSDANNHCWTEIFSKRDVLLHAGWQDSLTSTA